MTRKATPSRALLSALRQRAGAFIETAHWWLNPLPRPSFLQRFEIQRRIYAAALTSEGRRWGELWPWESKTGARRLARVAAVAVPELLRKDLSTEHLSLDSLPNEFALKPVRGYGRNGVYVLRREGSHYRDLLRGNSKISESGIRANLISLGEQGLIGSDNLIAEAAILRGSELPFDWKVYSFQGETPLIVQIARGPCTEVSYYSGEWKRLGEIRRGRGNYSELPPPMHPTSLLNAASALSKLLPLPFARIDLYESESQVFLGEITPVPGGRQRFTHAIDAALGEAWERAEARLLTGLLRTPPQATHPASSVRSE